MEIKKEKKGKKVPLKYSVKPDELDNKRSSTYSNTRKRSQRINPNKPD